MEVGEVNLLGPFDVPGLAPRQVRVYLPRAYDPAKPSLALYLFDGQNVEDSIHRSKAVGEPPLLLPFSVFFAIRDAVAYTGDGHANPPLRAPATSEAILRAIQAVRKP